MLDAIERVLRPQGEGEAEEGGGSAERRASVDRIYLDTTFLDPHYKFDTFESTVQRVVNIARDNAESNIVIGGDTLGKVGENVGCAPRELLTGRVGGPVHRDLGGASIANCRQQRAHGRICATPPA